MTTNIHARLKHAAIDLGFYQVKLAMSRATGPLGSEIVTSMFNSYAPTVDKNQLAHMEMAKDAADGALFEVNDVAYFVGASAMNMFDATGYARVSNEKYCTTPTYKALFLGALWQLAKSRNATGGLTIDSLVLGLPFTTLIQQHVTVRDMALGEHRIPSPFKPNHQINVTVKSATVVAQPQGGAVNYANSEGRNLVKPHHKILVLDMGGGTFDWFVCNGEFQPNYALSDATPIGTLNCAAKVLDQIKPSFKNNPDLMERVDSALRLGQDEFEIGGQSYKVADYISHVEGLISKAITTMRGKVGDLDVFDHILLTGGGAELLGRFCAQSLEGRQRVIRMDSDPVFSNVKGFYIISELLEAGE